MYLGLKCRHPSRRILFMTTYTPYRRNPTRICWWRERWMEGYREAGMKDGSWIGR